MPPTEHRLVCERCNAEVASGALFCPMCGSPRARKTGDPLIGEIIGDRYLLRDRLGQGASGTIYLAEHITLHRLVAVKILHHELSRDDLALERFRREATTVGEIDNEHIVEVFDFGRTGDGRMFLVMERLEGETLAAAIKHAGKLPIPQVVDVLAQIGEALMEAHAMGYIHRDLRPGNVFLSRRRGVEGFIKILDFGLAKLVEKDGEAPSTNLGMTFGDPCYMSPEQARGDPVDRRADIYALGIMAYEMLTGAPPFVGKRVFDVLTQHLETQPGPPSRKRSDVPLWLDAVVLRCLAKRPEDRFVTVYRLTEALRAGEATGHIMTDEAAKSMPSITPPAPAPRPREPEPEAKPGNGKRKEHSGAWYAEGEDLVDKTDKSVAADSLMSEYAPPPRRLWPWVAGGLGTAAVVALIVFSLSGRKEPVVAAVPQSDAAPAVAVAPEVTPDAAPAPQAEVVVPPPEPTPPVTKPAAKPERRPAKPASKLPSKPREPDARWSRPPVVDLRPKPIPAPTPPAATEPPPPAAEPSAPDEGGPAASESEFYIKLGHRALRAGDYEGARAAFNKAREYEVANADAIAGLGEIAMAQGSYDEATVHFEAASRLSPRSARIHVLRGRALLGAGRRQDAAAAFKKALSINPGDAAAQKGYQEATGG